MAGPHSPFHLYMVVWGEAYINKFFKYAVPTLLSDKNLPNITAKRICTFNIVTSEHNINLLQGSDELRALSNYLKINVYPSDIDNVVGDKYTKMTTAHHFLCKLHAGTDCYAVFVSPDTLVSNGALSYFHQTILTGKQAIVMIGLRVIEEELSNCVLSTTESRNLVSLAFKHGHAELQSWLMNQDEIQSDPAFFIWPHGKVWVVHALYALPVVVSMLTANPDDLGRAIEVGNFLSTAVTNRDLIEVVSDSDSAVLVGVSLKNDITGCPTMPPTVLNVKARIYKSDITDLHRYFFTKPILIHSENLSNDLSNHLQATSTFVNEVLSA